VQEEEKGGKGKKRSTRQGPHPRPGTFQPSFHRTAENPRKKGGEEKKGERERTRGKECRNRDIVSSPSTARKGEEGKRKRKKKEESIAGRKGGKLRS